MDDVAPSPNLANPDDLLFELCRADELTAFGVVRDVNGVFDVLGVAERGTVWIAGRAGRAVEIEAVGRVVVRIEDVVKIEDFVGIEDVVEIGVVDVECVNIRCPETNLDFENHCDAYYSMRCLQSKSSLGQQAMAREVGRLA